MIVSLWQIVVIVILAASNAFIGGYIFGRSKFWAECERIMREPED